MAGTATWLSASGQSGQRDLAPGCLAATFLVRAAYGARVREHLTEVPDPHRLGAGRGHADDAFADAHLRPDTLGRVPDARDRVQPLARLVEQHEQRVLVPEQLRQARQRRAHERVEIGTAGEARAELARGGTAAPRRTRASLTEPTSRPIACIGQVDRRGNQVELRPRGRRRAAQLEDVLHAGERSDRVDVTPEPFEQRAPPLRPLVREEQPVAVVTQRVDDDDGRPRVLGEVARRLREELVRQRDVLVVDHVHAREVGDVGHTVGRRGRDLGRDDAFEAGLDVAQRQRVVRRQRHASTLTPRLGRDACRPPGRASGRRPRQPPPRHATTSSGAIRHTSSSGVPSSSAIACTHPAQNASKRTRSAAVRGSTDVTRPLIWTDDSVWKCVAVSAITPVASTLARVTSSVEPRSSRSWRPPGEHVDGPASGGLRQPVGVHGGDDLGARRLEERLHVRFDQWFERLRLAHPGPHSPVPHLTPHHSRRVATS